MHPGGLRIGIDPWLHTITEIRALEKIAAERHASVVRLATNPVDAIWEDRPPEPLGAVSVQPEAYAGRTAEEKLAAFETAIAEKKADACIVTDPSSVAWIFNIRGSDVPHTPHPLAFAIIVPGQENTLLIDRRKIDKTAEKHLSGLAALREPDQLETAIAGIGDDGASIMIDVGQAPARLGDLIVESGAKTVEAADPARLPRARKNPVELAGSRAAHLRDGAAMVVFLAWLDAQKPGDIGRNSRCP